MQGPLKVTEKVSLSSEIKSPITGTNIVVEVSPASIVSVLSVDAVKSAGESAESLVPFSAAQLNEISFVLFSGIRVTVNTILTGSVSSGSPSSTLASDIT